MSQTLQSKYHRIGGPCLQVYYNINFNSDVSQKIVLEIYSMTNSIVSKVRHVKLGKGNK